jgi:diadenosine tetraphosphate (Ap4A) HIT family hydrolase
VSALVAGVEGCLACDLFAGRVELPGGRIHETDHWLVEHCIGPLGVGTLVVKPKRHVVHVWELEGGEADELGSLLHETASVVAGLTRPDQVYVCLWSHSGGEPVHIHFVVQPVTKEQRDRHGGGARLQVAMFDADQDLPLDEVEAFAAQARLRFGGELL